MLVSFSLDMKEEEKAKSTVQLLESIVASGQKLTPMMEQYYNIKKQYPETLLLFRMGDFYELFFDDAREASQILNIALTHRGKIADIAIPMAGIPHHAANAYIDRITSCGKKAAICEQTEDPKLAKGIVKRAVTQVVSPGMPFDLEKAEKYENKYMASAYYQDGKFSLSFIDYTTGDFFGMILESINEVAETLSIYSPKEFLSFLGQWDNFHEFNESFERTSILKTHLSQEYFETKHTQYYIGKIIPGFERDETLKSNSIILNSIGALAYYICSTQSLESLSHIRPYRLQNKNQSLKVTYPTLVGLEILPSYQKNYKDSVLGFFDKTKTSMGTRKLKEIFQTPLRNIDTINQRLDIIDYFKNNQEVLVNVKELLKDIRDLDRIMAKVTTSKANGADLLNLAQGIQIFFQLEKILPPDLVNLIPKWKNKTDKDISDLAKKLISTLNDEIGANLEKGNLIKDGVCPKRDRLASLSQSAASELVKLETQYRKRTGINTLKIKSNNVAGYFIEVSKSHMSKVPKTFQRKQTLVNSERYLTQELLDFEKDIVSAKDKLYKLERQIFDDLLSEITHLSSFILELASSLALIDCFQSFSWMAIQEGLSRPHLRENKKILNVKNAWHPLIKANIKDHFVSHSLSLDSNQFFGLITGPNISGKKTVMREMAIIQFLAQLGSFVPAQNAELNLCDYLFSRLGASDDIIRGQSTFMVEMSETAEIIRHATENSLIILDEIGRGTSTFDGLSIAWALVEYLNKKTKAITLFSTHYHELIDLVKDLITAKNLTVKTVNYKGKVQFLYTLIEEGATQSFGIHVAELAGLPQEILNRSQEILSSLENNTHQHKKIIEENKFERINQLSFLQEQPIFHIPEYLEKLEREIQDLDIINLTPLQAIQKLDHLKNEIIRH